MREKQKLHIRKASLTDLETLLKFQQALVDAERPFDPTLKKGDIYYYNLEELIANPQCEVLVADDGEQVIGSGYVRILEAKSFLKHDIYAYLGFMYVDPNFRRMGIVQLILERLLEWCKTKNLTEIRLEVYAGNEKALKAYEKAGFKQHMIEMRLG